MLPLKEFQIGAVRMMVDLTGEVMDGSRNAVVALLSAPTAAGKTVMLCATLRQVSAANAREGKKVAWFWFAPFKGLIGQAEATLRREAEGLRLRRLSEDRQIEVSQDGDTWVSTWSLVAAKEDSDRKVMEGDDRNASVFALVSALKRKDFKIGVVIDEAHHSVGKFNEAFGFLKRISPDIVLMASATPDQARADDIARMMGAETANIRVSRRDVVAEGINKPNAVSAVVAPDDVAGLGAQVYDVAIRHAVKRNQAITKVLLDLGISIQPLLLVQVENGKTTVDEARALLTAAGMQPDEIAVHTSDEPDPRLLELANDDSKKALIFKTAVATGFDAPRAFVMAALRKVMDKDFGLQILGRLMRVHPLLQGRDDLPSILRTAYLVLTFRDSQPGLKEAIKQLNGMRTDIEVYRPKMRKAIPGQGVIGYDPAALTEDKRPEAISRPLRSDLHGLTGRSLLTEVALERTTVDWTALASSIPGLSQQKLLGWIHANKAEVAIDESVLLAETDDVATVARTKVKTIRDPGQLRNIALRALRGLPDRRPVLTALRHRIYNELGDEALEEHVLTGLYAFLAYEPSIFRDALAKASAELVNVVSAAPLPDFLSFSAPPEASAKNIYGAMPEGLEGEWETGFARWLDASDEVLWWHKNEPRKPHSVAVLREDGRPYYPDFVARIRGRKGHGIVLIDPHDRYQDAEGNMKWRARHTNYGRVLMLYKSKDDGAFKVIVRGDNHTPKPGPTIEGRMLISEE